MANHRRNKRSQRETAKKWRNLTAEEAVRLGVVVIGEVARTIAWVLGS
jgi:hypothetical protein